jgi:hypothetical protein
MHTRVGAEVYQWLLPPIVPSQRRRTQVIRASILFLTPAVLFYDLEPYDERLPLPRQPLPRQPIIVPIAAFFRCA